jgi:glutaredoxin
MMNLSGPLGASAAPRRIIDIFQGFGIMRDMKGIYIFWGLIILIVFAVLGSSLFISAQPGRLDSFAQCLKDRGAVFYGAFWCPHCAAQKALFGRSSVHLPYVECSTPDGQGQLQICVDKEITNYPTWIFADGERLTGEIPLQQLAEKTQCELPA